MQEGSAGDEPAMGKKRSDGVREVAVREQSGAIGNADSGEHDGVGLEEAARHISSLIQTTLGAAVHSDVTATMPSSNFTKMVPSVMCTLNYCETTYCCWRTGVPRAQYSEHTVPRFLV